MEVTCLLGPLRRWLRLRSNRRQISRQEVSTVLGGALAVGPMSLMEYAAFAVFEWLVFTVSMIDPTEDEYGVSL